jgi:hypothetical protein
MIDTLGLYQIRESIRAGNPFDIVPYLSDVTERHNEKQGTSCTGKALDFFVKVYESGNVFLDGSLSKFYFENNNIETLTRKATQNAVEKLSDFLHTDITTARVTRIDLSTIIPTKRPPSDYFMFLGAKSYFNRLQANPDTLYYNNHQRQIIFYDKQKEARAKGMKVPEILQESNLLRYELRILKRVNAQLKAEVTAGLLSNEMFYQSIVQRWYNEFETIQKLKNPSFMTENITTVKDAETALFAHLLQQSGQTVIDEFLNDLRAKSTFKERQRYSELKKKLNQILAQPKGQQSDLMQELETAIYNVAKYAR